MPDLQVLFRRGCRCQCLIDRCMYLFIRAVQVPCTAHAAVDIDEKRNALIQIESAALKVAARAELRAQRTVYVGRQRIVQALVFSE